MNFENLKLEFTSNKIVTLFFSNPKSRNAFNPEMIMDIKNALNTLKNSDRCRILIFRGEGDTFSSGADLSWMKKSINLNYEQNKKESKAFTEMLESIDNFPKPTISLVNGHAFGGALGVIAASDYSFSYEKCNFCFSEVKLGLIPAMIAPYIVRSLGYKVAKKLFLTGEIFDAKKALTIGLIDEIINNTENKIMKLELLDNLLRAAPEAQNNLKSFLKKISLKDIDEKLTNYTAETISKIRVTKEAQEGLSAFLEKRKPAWRED